MMNNADIEKYIAAHTSDEEPLLSELDRATNLNVVQPRMISGHVQGEMLKILSKMLSPRRILEIGTFTGYSAICLAAGLPEGGELHTIEIDDELESLAADFFARADTRGHIFQHVGSALDIAPRLGGCFDLVFIDGDKREYPAYYEMLFSAGLVGSGSIILADNVLWYGKILEEVPANDRFTQRILEFNKMVQDDPRVENVILPIRDGITLIRVR